MALAGDEKAASRLALGTFFYVRHGGVCTHTTPQNIQESEHRTSELAGIGSLTARSIRKLPRGWRVQKNVLLLAARTCWEGKVGLAGGFGLERAAEVAQLPLIFVHFVLCLHVQVFFSGFFFTALVNSCVPQCGSPKSMGVEQGGGRRREEVWWWWRGRRVREGGGAGERSIEDERTGEEGRKCEGMKVGERLRLWGGGVVVGDEALRGRTGKKEEGTQRNRNVCLSLWSSSFLSLSCFRVVPRVPLLSSCRFRSRPLVFRLWFSSSLPLIYVSVTSIRVDLSRWKGQHCTERTLDEDCHGKCVHVVVSGVTTLQQSVLILLVHATSSRSF